MTKAKFQQFLGSKYNRASRQMNYNNIKVPIQKKSSWTAVHSNSMCLAKVGWAHVTQSWRKRKYDSISANRLGVFPSESFNSQWPYSLVSGNHSTNNVKTKRTHTVHRKRITHYANDQQKFSCFNNPLTYSGQFTSV